MAIDKPLDQALAQVKAERRDTNPAIAGLTAARPFVKAMAAGAAAPAAHDTAGLLAALKGFSEVFSRDRSAYLLNVVISEVQALVERFDRLDSRQQEYLDRDWPALLLDAERKARDTRGKEKIARIGKILNSAAYSNPPQAPDTTEEFMRIATSLDDLDVQVLKIIYDHQGNMVRSEFGRVRGYDAYSNWPSVCAVATRTGMLRGDLDAMCGKLESFGLVTRGERHSNLIGDDPTPFALLQRGKNFLEQLQFSAQAPAG